MEYQILFNIAFAAAGTLGGFVLKNIWDAMRDLQKADSSLADKVSSIEILVAGQYVRRDVFDSKIDALFNKLDSMETKFENKLDRALSHRDHTQ